MVVKQPTYKFQNVSASSKTQLLEFKKVLLRYFCKKIQQNVLKNKAQNCKNQKQNTKK